MRAYEKKLKQNRLYKSQLKSGEVLEGESIEKKVQRLIQSNEPIKDGAPEIFTERKDGVEAGYNIRTDRFELAAEAMDKVAKSLTAARDNKGKVVELNPKENNSGAESTHGNDVTKE